MARITEREIRKWRSSRRYRVARQHYLNSYPLCAYCQEAGYTVGADELDHIIPVHKRPDLFWDRSNWQGLCIPCHKGKSDIEHRGLLSPKKRIWGSTLDGDPIEMAHKITLVGGCIASGKTTWVHKHRTKGDLIIDVDTLWDALTGTALTAYHREDALPYILAARNAVITTLAQRRDINAWVISADYNRPRFNILARRLGAEVVVIVTPRELCLERVADRPYPARPPDTWEELVNRWHDSFTTEPSDQLIR